MADYIGTAQYGKPIEYSSQPNGGTYPSWINTDYSGIFDALGESISGVIKAKKEAAEEEKKEKEKLEKANSALIEKYYIDMPETGDDSQYFLTKVDDYNNTAKGYIDAAISAGNSYLTPEQIVELKKKSNAILAEKNLSDLNQSTVSEVRKKYFSQEGQYDPTAFNDWMKGYNEAGTIQDKAKYIQQNKNPLVPVVTLGDAFKDMKTLNLGTTTKMMGNTAVTVVDPQNVEDGIALMETQFPESNTARYINAGKDEAEKEQRRDSIVKAYGLQEDTREYRKIARGATRSGGSGSQSRVVIGYDPKIGGDHENNYLNVKGLSREGALTDNTGQLRTNAVIEQIEAFDGKIYARGTYKDDDGATQTAIFNYDDNKGSFEAAGGKDNIEKMKKRKSKGNTQTSDASQFNPK